MTHGIESHMTLNLCFQQTGFAITAQDKGGNSKIKRLLDCYGGTPTFGAESLVSRTPNVGFAILCSMSELISGEECK